MNPVLKIGENFAVDESITDYETYAFNPITEIQLNNPGSITITIQNSDNWYHMCNSRLEFEGQLVKASDGKPFEAADKISFANNGIMFLFDNIKYLLSSAGIESVYNPGIASNILGMAKYSSNYAPRVKQCWAPDTCAGDDADTNLGFKARREFTAKDTPVGCFPFAVPLRHIFGFAEDYHCVIYGFNHTLVVLTRASSDTNALFRHTDDQAKPEEKVPAGKSNLTNLRWMVQRVKPADVARYELEKQIKAETISNIGFRMHQCVSTLLPASNDFTWPLGVRTSLEQPRYIF